MKFRGFNWTLIGLFLVLFVIYGACRKRNEMTGLYQGGGAGLYQNGGALYQNGGADDEMNPDLKSPELDGDHSPKADSSDSSTQDTTPTSTPDSSTKASSTQDATSAPEAPSHSGMPVAWSEPKATATSAPGCDSIRNPHYPTGDLPSKDVRLNTIERQRRLIREYQSYIKNLRGQCCRRVYSGNNLLDNPLSNKNWEVRPMIANGGDNALYLMQDDFSNIMSISQGDAEKYKVSFYDQEPAQPRTFALQASENWPMYQRTFDRSFVSRIPDPPNMLPFKSVPWQDSASVGDSNYCPASKACGGTFSPPWTTNSAYTCQGLNFEKPRAPEPSSLCKNRIGQPPPYIPPASAPPSDAPTPTPSPSPSPSSPPNTEPTTSGSSVPAVPPSTN